MSPIPCADPLRKGHQCCRYSVSHEIGWICVWSVKVPFEFPATPNFSCQAPDETSGNRDHSNLCSMFDR